MRRLADAESFTEPADLSIWTGAPAGGAPRAGDGGGQVGAGVGQLFQGLAEEIAADSHDAQAAVPRPPAPEPDVDADEEC